MRGLASGDSQFSFVPVFCSTEGTDGASPFGPGSSNHHDEDEEDEETVPPRARGGVPAAPHLRRAGASREVWGAQEAARRGEEAVAAEGFVDGEGAHHLFVGLESKRTAKAVEFLDEDGNTPVMFTLRFNVQDGGRRGADGGENQGVGGRSMDCKENPGKNSTVVRA